MLTKKKIEKALPEGYYIHKAEGVWYFYGNNSHEWYNSCSDLTTITQGTLEEWVKALNDVKALKI